MQAGVDERPAEVQPLRVRMKNIGRPSRFQVGDHVRKGLEEKTIKVIPLDGVVLDGQPIRGLEGDAIGGISQDEVGLLPIHQRGHILCGGGVAANESMPAHRPDVAPLHKRGFLQGGGEVETVIVRGCFGEVGEHGGKLLFVKAGGIHVRAAGGKFGQQGRQLFIIPFASDFVERDVQPPFVHLGQFDHADLALRYAQVQQDAEPLVAADHVPRATVPHDGLHIPKGEDGRLQLLVGWISRLESLPGVVLRRIQFR